MPLVSRIGSLLQTVSRFALFYAAVCRAAGGFRWARIEEIRNALAEAQVDLGELWDVRESFAIMLSLICPGF
jgi:hypothetical protein